MALDQTNTLHLVWHIDDGERGLRDVYYAEFTNAEMDASEGAVVTSIPLNDSADLSQPVVGLMMAISMFFGTVISLVALKLELA